MKINSIKFKIGNLFTIILGIILILYSTFLLVSLSRYLIADLDKELAAKVDELGNIISDELNASTAEDIYSIIQRIFSFQYPPKSDISAVKKKKTVGEPLSEEEKWFVRFDRLDLSQDMVAFFETKGHLLFSSQNIPNNALNKFMPNLNVDLNIDMFDDISINKKIYRVMQSSISLNSGQQIIVVIATTEKPVVDLLRYRQRLIMVSIPIILLLTAFLGRFLAERILRPVNKIVSTAQQITSHDLSKRLDVKNVDYEMKVLVDSFNNMIARLEESFKHIEEFSSQVAHELKTPLAILRGETEVVLRKEQNAAEYKLVLKDNLNEIEKIIRIVEDLLLSAKLDYRPKFLNFQEFDFKEFLTISYEQIKLLADEKSINISCVLPKENIIFNGDSLHLRRLFFNIIHNAIKFTPAGKQITIRAVKENNSLKVSISDEGPGIPEEYISKIFDKFFQVPHKNHDLQKGSGLGLNIAQSIAKSHQGKIEVTSQLNKGTVFLVILPLY